MSMVDHNAAHESQHKAREKHKQNIEIDNDNYY